MTKPFAIMSAIVIVLGLAPSAALASSSCSFSLKTYKGESVSMQSYVSMSLNSLSPSGEISTGTKEVLRVDFTAKGSGCENVFMDGYGFGVMADDKASTNWLRDLKSTGAYAVDVKTGEKISVSQHSWMVRSNGKVTDVRFKMSTFEIAAGDTRTIAFYIDASDASASKNDTLKAYILEDSLAWHDRYTKIFRMDHDRLYGNLVWF